MCHLRSKLDPFTRVRGTRYGVRGTGFQGTGHGVRGPGHVPPKRKNENDTTNENGNENGNCSDKNHGSLLNVPSQAKTN